MKICLKNKFYPTATILNTVEVPILYVPRKYEEIFILKFVIKDFSFYTPTKQFLMVSHEAVY